MKLNGGWSRRFDDAIPLPRGRALVTLRDAAECITALPKAKQAAAEWQAATEALLLVVELNGPTMFARIAMMQALNRHSSKPVPEPRRKAAKAYKVVR